MKVVFDTNVLISAFVFGGNSAKAFDKCVEKHDISISQYIIDELSDKLKNKFHIPLADISKITGLLKNELMFHRPATKLPEVCRDKDDNHILQLAESAESDLIITGDKDLLVLKKYKTVTIISPKDFLELYRS